jgi:protein phosphatase
VARRLALTLMVHLVLEDPIWIFSKEEAYIQAAIDVTAKRFQQVHAALLAKGREDPRLFKMGTTLTVARSLGTDLIVAHVGDSRAYLFRQGRLQRLTRDHTLAQELSSASTVAGIEAIANRFRHLLTQSLGADRMEIEPQIVRDTLASGDRLLLCTDGLSDQAPEEAIVRELARGAAAKETCEKLVQLALDHGGKDNVTVAIADYRITQGR